MTDLNQINERPLDGLPVFDSRVLEKNVFHFLKDNNLWDFESKLVLAISGGPDSIALLHILYKITNEPSHKLIIAHFDHGNRADSSEDASFVHQISSDLKLSFFSARLDHCVDHGQSKEAFWRKNRYSFLEKIRIEQKAESIATGHTLDDHIETVLMRIILGAGPRGSLGINSSVNHCIRPLLNIKHADLLCYLEQNKYDFHDDPTNKNINIPRNRVRHVILPKILELNPNIHKSMWTWSAILSDENEFISNAAQLLLKKSGYNGRFPARIDCVDFKQAPIALLRRCAAAILNDLLEADSRITHLQIENLASLLAQKSRNFSLPGNIRGEILREQIHIYRFSTPSVESQIPLLIGIAEKLSFKDWNLSVKSAQNPAKNLPISKGILIASCFFPIYIRTRCPGDRMITNTHPLTVRRLKECFTELGIPSDLRSCQPLIVDSQNRILAIVGHTKSALLTETPSDGCLYRIIWRQIKSQDEFS
jgi:tRNA(Ile)-lysidine synthase